MLTLMYITNRPEVALIAQNAGVDRIFLDLETIGKSDRQRGMDTVQSSHTIADIQRVKEVLTTAELLVRCNSLYSGSAQEIDALINAGANVVMLPYFTTAEEAKTFIQMVGGRAKVCLLIETPQAVENIDEILALDGVDEVHIGINDLSIGYGKKFLFEVLSDGTVDALCQKFKAKGIPYGFRGSASLGRGLLSSECVIMEHYRLGSTRAILSRSFCNTEKMRDLSAVKVVFNNGVKAIREYEEYCAQNSDKWEDNRIETAKQIDSIVAGL